MSTLALTVTPLQSRSSGYDIRVLNLCAQTTGEVHLLVVPLRPGQEDHRLPPMGEVFATTDSTAPILEGSLSPRRHLRTSNDHFLRRAAPAGFESARRQILRTVQEHGVSQVVAFGAAVAELAATLEDQPVIVDVCDSSSLTMRRRLQVLPPRSTRERLQSWVDLRRVEATEGGLPHRVRYATTVSDADTLQVQKLAGPTHNIVTIPNGVDPAFLGQLVPPSLTRSVAFWGNLAFEPNQDALRFFLDEIYRPFLVAAGVQLWIYGPNAPDWLVEAADQNDGITLAGFVPDLALALPAHPVMVNPMRIGSGLKNKVLEAFGLGLAVVSTQRGMEAVPTVRDGVHVSLADDPGEFAARTLELLDDPQKTDALRAAARELLDQNYRWERVGASWRALLAGELHSDSSEKT